MQQKTKISPRMILLMGALLVGLSAIAPLASHAASGTVTYEYDKLGRVISVTYDNGRTVTYTYDNAGNRLTQTVTIPSP